MATERKPIPALAVSAFNQLQIAVNTESQNLFQQTLDVMGLSVADGWTLDLPTKSVVRTIPDAE